jgi:hypothetical protein
VNQSNKRSGFAALYDLAEKKKAEQNQADRAGTPVATPVHTPVPTPVDTPVATPVPSPQSTTKPGSDQSEFEDRQQYLDATHSASEKSLYSVMYRETVSKGSRERHFGFKELSTKTGIRSDRTVRIALQGLREKLSIEVISYHHGNPIGPRYRVYDPREIMRRRKAAGIEIDTQTKKITSGTPVATGVPTGVVTPVPTPVGTGGKIYGSTPVESTGVTPVDSTGVYKYINEDLAESQTSNPSSSNKQRSDDDEAYARLVGALKKATEEISGRASSPAEAARWEELADVLVAELKIAAARTTVSSVPSFLAEHLRRRLWKVDKRQARAEGRELPDETMKTAPTVDATKCPDCAGSGWHYPEGMERGVKKCKHEKLNMSQESDESAT